MSKTVIVRLIWDILIVVFLVGFVLALLWYTNGSLETMPTEEQQEKAQIAAVCSMIVTGIPCMSCIVLRWRMK